MKYKALHCWDCGAEVIRRVQGLCYPLPNLREVKYGWSNGAYSESPFCDICAYSPWPPARIAAFKAGLDAINPDIRSLSITGIEGVSIPRDVIGVLGK